MLPQSPRHQVALLHLYFCQQWVPFQTNDITKKMRYYTGQTLGYEIGVSDWRHISIAIRRKHCPALLEMADDSDKNTTSALQASYSMQTENRIYGLEDSANATGTHLALQSFLKASTEWQNRCRVFPGGTNLPYFEVTAKAYDTILKNAQEVAKRAAEQASLPNQETLDKIAEAVVLKLNLNEELMIANKMINKMREPTPIAVNEELLSSIMPRIQSIIEQSIAKALD